MKISKQMWLVVAIILVGIAAAGLILKTDEPVIDEHGEHAEKVEAQKNEPAKEADVAMPPKHGESGHEHEKDHLPAQKIQKDGDDANKQTVVMTKYVKGPHGGKLFTDGDYALEVTIYEQNQPPVFRLYTYLNNKPLAPKESQARLVVSRLGRAAETFTFSQENDYLASPIVVYEPHSFKVDINTSYAGKTHQFGYDQAETRVTMTDEQLKQNAVQVLTAAPASIQTTLRMLGEIKLNADKAVQVLPRISGVVETVAANVGDTVKRGQTLAIVSSPTVAENRGDLAAAQQQLSLAKTTLAREESLWREKISAEQDYLAAKSEVRMAEIALMRQQQKLASMGIAGGNGTRYTLTAPISGVITRKNIAVGQLVDMSQMLFEVADLSTVWAEMTIPTKDLGLVKAGQKVTVNATAFEQSAAGTITYIAPLVSEQSRTATARVVLENAKQNWLVGLPVDIDLVAEEVSVPISVSVEAIQTIRFGEVVFGRYGEYFEARPLQLGRRDSKNVEVLAGLNAGEQYAAGNSFIIKAELGKAGASHDH